MTFDPDDVEHVRWALLFTAQEARRHGCPYFEAKLRELAATLVEGDEERAS